MCLFRTQVVSPLGRSAPYLVPIEHTEKLVEVWRNHGLGQSWGIFVSSAEPQARLRQRLRTFNQAKLPDGQVVLFRWWDPRVFRVYLPTCDADDLKQWFASVEEYVCEDADGDGFTIYRHGLSRNSARSAGTGSRQNLTVRPSGVAVEGRRLAARGALDAHPPKEAPPAPPRLAHGERFHDPARPIP